MNNSPCMNCGDRKLNCHNNCRKYKNYRNKVDKANERKMADYQYRCYLGEVFERGQL